MDPRIPFYLVGAIILIWVIWGVAEEHGRKKDRRKGTKTISSTEIAQNIARRDRQCPK